jgi:hypothetical protein
VGERAVDADMLRLAEALVKPAGVFMPDAEPAHPGVDLQVDGHDAAGLFSNGLETFDLLLGRDGSGDVVFEEIFVLLRQQGAQDQDRPARAEFTDRGSLRHVGHGKKIRPRVHETRHRLVQSVAVGVRLDNGDVFDVRRQRSADEPQVAFECGEVDFGPTAERQ